MLLGLVKRWISGSVRDKGLRGGSALWLTVGAFNLLQRLYRRMGKRSEVLSLAERLRPGDELVLKYPGKPDRKVRKEKRIVAEHRARLAAEKKRQIDRLEVRVAAGGRKGRKAARALAKVVNDTR